jgi:hypothetical protein
MDDEKILPTAEDAVIAPAVDVVAAAAANAIAAIEAPDTLPPNERVRAAIQRALARIYPESRRGEAAIAIRDFARVAADLLRRFEYKTLYGKIGEFNQDMQMLEIRAVPPPPTEREVWGRRLATATYGSPLSGEFRYIGYAAEECDALWRTLQPGEKISGFDIWEIRTTTRTISRRELRLGTAPRFKTLLPDWDPEQFLRKFPELPPRERTE